MYGGQVHSAPHGGLAVRKKKIRTISKRDKAHVGAQRLCTRIRWFSTISPMTPPPMKRGLVNVLDGLKLIQILPNITTVG